MYVNLLVTVGFAQHAFLVPQAALQRDNQGAYVLTVGADDTVIEKRVQTEGASGVDWIVSSGLVAGDRIIVAGIQSATPGAKVAAVEEQQDHSKPTAAATAVTPAAGPRRVASADTKQ
jgi:membrane fusion protein (multidrug efflux system)